MSNSLLAVLETSTVETAATSVEAAAAVGLCGGSWVPGTSSDFCGSVSGTSDSFEEDDDDEPRRLEVASLLKLQLQRIQLYRGQPVATAADVLSED